MIRRIRVEVNLIATTPTRETGVWRWAGGVIRLLRPLNLLILLVGVGTGALLAAEERTVASVLGVDVILAALSAMFVGGAANSMNDYFDLEIDRINRPDRPLPSAIVSPGAARIIWIAGSVIGVVLGFWLSLPHVALATGSVALLYLYNLYWKRTVLIGNVVVAFMTALALVYGAWAVGKSGPVLAGATFAFLTTLAREIIKDVEDEKGDAAAAARTVAVVWGARRATTLAAGVLAATILLTPVPYLLLDYGDSYLLAVILADAALLYAIWCLLRPDRTRYVSRASGSVKWAMVLGIIALAVATAV